MLKRFSGILLLLLVVLATLFLFERQAVYEQARSDITKSVTLERESLSRRVSAWHNGINGLARLDAIRRLVAAIDDNQSTLAARRAIEQTFGEFQRSYDGQILSLRLIDRFGQELVVVRDMQVDDDLLDLSNNDDFRKMMAHRPFQVLPGISSFGGKESLSLNINIASSGIVIAVLMMEINAQDLMSYLGKQLDASFRSIYFIDDRGEVVVESHNGKPGIKRTELKRVLEIFDDQDMESNVVNNSGSLWGSFKDDALNTQVLVSFEAGQINERIIQQFIPKAIVFTVGMFVALMLVARKTQQTDNGENTTQFSLPRVSPRKTPPNMMNVRELAVISNEIRVPLSSILGMLSLLRETKLSTKQREYIDLANRSGEWGLELLNELVDYSRFKSNELKLENIDFNLRNTIKDVVEMLSIEAYKKGLEVTSLISSQVPERVSGDPSRLRQVLISLITQAIRFTDHGDIAVSASVASVKGEGKDGLRIRFEVNDTGVGVDSELQKAFFEEPESGLVVADDEYNTSALGLNLSKKIVELMRGEIGVGENGTGGATFWFEIPYALAQVVPQRAMQSSLEGHRVFLIGEIEGNRNTISTVLSKWGMQCESSGEFTTAEKVLAKSARENGPISFCIIDISLSSSGKKAFELAQKLQAQEETSETNIIILTAKGAPGEGQTARELGIKAYLSKPISRSQLQDTLLQIVAGMDSLGELSMVTKHSLKESKPAGHTVLIVEDNFTNQKVLAGFLSRMGVNADIATDGVTAIEAVKRRPYDLVIMDTQMPEMGGLETTKAIREYEYSLALGDDQSLERAIRTPIVAMSASFQDEEKEECLRVGMDGFLKKPVNMKSMEDLLLKWGLIDSGYAQVS